MITLYWNSSSLVIENPPDDLRQTLRYEHKSMKPDGVGGMVSSKEVVQLYAEAHDGSIVTYQGFLDRIRRQLGDRPHQVMDRRFLIPEPLWHRSGGFRHFQQSVFVQALKQGRSGLIQIPTRTGKSYLALNMMKVWPKVSTVFAAPGVDLLNQQADFFREQLPGREIKSEFSGARHKGYSPDITVCSLDSLEKLPLDDIRLLIIDEPHAAVSPSRQRLLSKINNARIYGLGATVTGRYDNADILLEGLMGPVLVRKTFAEAVEAGAICNIVVHMLRVPVPAARCRNRDQAYRMILYENPEMNQLVTRMVRDVIPQDWQTLVFIDEKKQGRLMQQAVENGMLAIAGDMTPKQRRENFQGMTEGTTMRGISTDIYGTGVTFPHLRVIINAAGGGGSISSTQKPGRLAQMRPGKKHGHLIDFLFTEPPGLARGALGPHVEMVVRDGYNRRQAYERNGYEIRIVDSPDQIRLD